MTENVKNTVSTVKNVYYCLPCKWLISLFVTQTHYVEGPSIKVLIKCISQTLLKVLNMPSVNIRVFNQNVYEVSPQIIFQFYVN